MRNIILIFFFIFISSCTETSFIANVAKNLGNFDKTSNYKIGDPYEINGKWYYPEVDYEYDEVGLASWYGPKFHGKRTANGEIFNQNSITAAHKTLPMPSIVKVTNLENKRELVLRINDRGPFVRGRIIDLSKKSAELLGILKNGTANVRVKILETESRRLASENLNLKSNFDVKSAETKKIYIKSIDNSNLTESNKIKDYRLQLKNKLVIQVGAFNNQDNAFKLVQKLLKFEAYIKREIIKGKDFYRVRIGPFSDIKNAKRILKKLLINGFNNSRIIPNYETN